MTAPVVDAGFLAPIVARIDRLEVALVLIRDVVNRQMGDVGHLDVAVEELEAGLRELRNEIRGRS
jgi:hypothetical protein